MMLGFSSRGLAYWSDGDDASVIWGTGDGYLISVDAATGKPSADFGESGRVDLIEGFPRADRGPPTNYSVTSAPLVVRDTVIVGSAITDQPYKKEMPPGHVRAFDVRSGELQWMFHTVPQRGQFGYDTWAPGTAEVAGNANVWSFMSADEELGYVYLPIGSPTNDLYGGHRHGDNLFANSLVAVDVETGERQWHFQLVHHDLWDSDAAAAPNLVNITVDGKPIKAVAQPAKKGWVYVFDRETGEPVWPIEERPVPQSDVPGEQSSPTQPYPTRPPAFDRQGLTVDDLIDFTPELRQEAEEILNSHRHGSIFEPPSLAGGFGEKTQGTLNLPSYIGGANWHSAAVDPETGLMYVPSMTVVSRSALTEPKEDDATLNYVRDYYSMLDVRANGMPLTKPPYGRISAIDLNEGEIVWQKANGPGSPRVLLQPAVAGLDLPDVGSGWDHLLATKTLLISGQSGPNRQNEAVLVARNKATGEVIAEIVLPGRVQAAPVTYMADGDQYIAVVIAGSPPEVLALRLPNN
jgi:quinoprotein glucose dehydrogenase